MKKIKKKIKPIKLFGILTMSCLGCLAYVSPVEWVQATKSVATHIGTFEGRTTFTTSSSNGINPGLFIEVMDDEGNLTQYESEEGVITIPDTKEGAYITQAKLLGKTKYVDRDTGEILDNWEEGRNLSLVSVENPILETVGKNLFATEDVDLTHTLQTHQKYMYVNELFDIGGYGNGNKIATKFNRDNSIVVDLTIDKLNSFVPFKFKGLKPNTDYVLSFIPFVNDPQTFEYIQYLFSCRVSKADLGKRFYVSITTDDEGEWDKHIWYAHNSGKGYIYNLIDFQLEEGSVATSYEPYQSNVLTVNEEVILCGIGDVRDELDLITGEVKENFVSIKLDGSENWSETIVNENIRKAYIRPTIREKSGGEIMCGQFPTVVTDQTIGIRLSINGGLYVQINNSLGVSVKEWLQSNPINAIYEVNDSLKSTNSVALTSTYFFKPINKDSIEVTGLIEPIMASITVPTDSLSFVLNPNEEAGQQFVAPEFSLINESLAPIQLELKAFEQTTDVLNDVLPEAYDSWEGLNQDQSKDIALALEPMPSEGWLALTEGPRYVANTLNEVLGTIKAKSKVDFMFSALHGQAFKKALMPQYQLTFVFELAS